MNQFAAPGATGAALMLIRDGAVIKSEAYGLADVSRSVPCTVKTNFRLASLTKAFTAMAILILSERGKLKIADPLSNYISNLPPWANAVTLHHLLSHASGVWDYEDLLQSTTPVKDRDVADLLRAQPAAYFQPGTNFRYSNTGYVLLALVVEAVSGISFAAFLRDHIFQPLQMCDTVAFENGVSIVPHRALGYTVSDSGIAETDQDLTSSTLGDGGIYSSVTDLFYWDQALHTEKLVRAQTLLSAFTPWSKSSDFADSGYGYGWYLAERRLGACQWHYGSTCGFSTWIERYPAQKLTLILLANRRDANLGLIARKIIDAL
jgi:CubicO group peptidase (beta-lactamase class C family)